MKERELVFFTGTNILKREAMCDTLVVANVFKGGDHRVVLRDLRNLRKKIKMLDKEEKALYRIVQSKYVNERGREYTKFNLNFNAYSLLVMGYTGQKAIEFKSKYIKAFNNAIEEITKLKSEYTRSKTIRNTFTDTIKELVPNINNFTYSNYTTLAYKIALGKSIKELREDKDIGNKEVIKHYMTMEELVKVEKVESKIELLLAMNKTIKDIKNMYAEGTLRA